MPTRTSRVAVVMLIGVAALAGCSKPDEKSSESAPAATPAETPSPGPGPSGTMVMQNAIVIVDSGSTNTIGYRITIGANGDASFISGDGPGRATLAADLYAKLKGDIDAAGPLSKIPGAGTCMKSASFGTTLTIALGGETSPDLNCVSTDVIQKLQDDAQAVVTALKIRSVPRGEGKALPPQNQ